MTLRQHLPTLTEHRRQCYDPSSAQPPARTPPEIVTKLNTEINAILSQPDVRKRFLNDGADPVGGSAEQFSAHINKEVQKWANVARVSSAKVD
jgi:tripartite-type tricarboxylate transporter receptor subunit TctC